MKDFNVFSIGKERIIIFGLWEIIVLVLSIVKLANLTLILPLTVWMAMLIYVSNDINNRIELGGFLICFFVFTIGGQFALYYLGYEYSHVFDDNIEVHTNIVLTVALIFLWIGYNISFEDKKEKKSKFEDEEYADFLDMFRICSKVAFYATAPFWFAVLIAKIKFALAYGYFAMYADYDANFSYIVTVLAGVAPILFYCVLASMPTKKQAAVPIIVYVIYNALSLMTGRRIYVVISVMMLIIYFVIRNKTDEEPWLRGIHVAVGLCLIPIALVLLQIYGHTRTGDEYNVTGLFSTIVDFMGSQGYTVNLVKYERLHSDLLGSNKFYSFYNTIRWFRTSRLTSWFVDQNYGFKYGTYTVENATLGNSFANSMTYIIAPYTFLQGGGTGSCYLAELFHDFSYVGIAAGNFVYGLILKNVYRFRNMGVIWMMISLVITEDMLRTPRYNFDQVISEFQTLTNFLIVGFVYVASYLIWRRYRYGSEGKQE